MKHIPSDQHQDGNTFGSSCVRLRKAMGLTQRELGRLLEVSRQAIQYWECGRHLPAPEHLKQLLVLCAQRHAFAPDCEPEEAAQLWLAARQKTPCNASWIPGQLAEQSTPPSRLEAPSQSRQNAPMTTRFDWGNASDVSNFYGRGVERSQLEHWTVQKCCRVISVVGIGGIGKTALATSTMHQMARHFEVVVFRSLRNAPPCQDLLADCLRALSPQSLPTMPANIDQLLDLLLECFQTNRCLLMLDSLESLRQEHDRGDHYLPDYENYGMLLRRVAETTHQSCLLLTSRETLVDLVQLESSQPSVHSLHLAGLEMDACERLFTEWGVVGTAHEQERLVDLYEGNPLALKIVAETIVELFGGKIRVFLEQGEVIFGSIRDLLTEQIARLPALEQSLLTWLAVVREPLGFDDLLAMLALPITGFQVEVAEP